MNIKMRAVINISVFILSLVVMVLCFLYGSKFDGKTYQYITKDIPTTVTFLFFFIGTIFGWTLNCFTPYIIKKINRKYYPDSEDIEGDYHSSYIDSFY